MKEKTVGVEADKEDLKLVKEMVALIKSRGGKNRNLLDVNDMKPGILKRKDE